MSILKKAQKRTLIIEAQGMINKFLLVENSNWLSAVRCSIKCCEILIYNEPGFTMLNPSSQLEWKHHWEEVTKILKSKIKQ